MSSLLRVPGQVMTTDLLSACSRCNAAAFNRQYLGFVCYRPGSGRDPQSTVGRPRVVLKETNRRGHAARLAQGAAADGLDARWSSEVTAPSTRPPTVWPARRLALGVLPGGSTNVFARTIGMANDPIEATSQLLSALAAGSVKRIGLGRANARYFLFHAGIGFDAAVVRRVEQMASLKRYFGPALFVVATLLTWAKGYDRRRPAFSLRPARPWSTTATSAYA